MPLWAEAPVAPTQTLSIDNGFTATANGQWGNFMYTISNGEVMITGYIGSESDVWIPNQMGVLPITTIGSMAFSRNAAIKTIHIPDSVTTIDEYAFFACTSITSLTIPASVTSLSSGAFYRCSSLSAITVDPANSAYASIDGLLYDSRLTSLMRCPEAKAGLVTIPEGVMSIASSAFAECAAVTSILIPSSVTSIGSTVFYRCTSLTSIDLPAGVTTIGDSSFYQCTSLTSINLPQRLTTIETSAFFGCTSLMSVTIPAGVTTIDSRAFYDCKSLTSITVDSGDSAYASIDGILYDNRSSSLIKCPDAKNGVVVIPDGVTGIGAHAFSRCVSLTTVDIPPTVAAIGNAAFSFCNRLTNLSIPVGVTSIGDETFYSCGSLASVTIPNGVTSIGRSAFWGCGNLASIEIPNTVTMICSNAFSISGLRSIDIPSSVRTIEGHAFGQCPFLQTIIIRSSSLSIASGIVYRCYQLRSVYFLGSPPTCEPQSFFVDQGVYPTGYRLPNTPLLSAGLINKVVQHLDVPAGQTGTATLSSDADCIFKEGSGVAVLDCSYIRAEGVAKTVVKEGELVLAKRTGFGLGDLDLGAGAKVTVSAGFNGVLANSVAFNATSRLEIGTGKVSLKSYNQGEVRSRLIVGRNGGSWDGAVGITSTAAGPSRAVGYAMAGSELKVAFAAPGDANLDGDVDVLDIAEIMSGGKFNTNAFANWQQGDVNYDDVFDILDISEILGTGLFNQGTYLTQASASSTAVEMGTVATFDPALVFAALAAEPTTQPTTKRKSF